MTMQLNKSVQGDDFLYDVVDLRLKPHEQKVVTVTSEQAAGFLQNGHYHIFNERPNPSSKAALDKKAMDEVNAKFGSVSIPRNPGELLKERDAEIEKLKAQLAASGVAVESDKDSDAAAKAASDAEKAEKAAAKAAEAQAKKDAKAAEKAAKAEAALAKAAADAEKAEKGGADA